MGKTIPSYRMALEKEIFDWKHFADSLRSREDREAFEQLMDACRSYASAGSNATRPVVFEAMLMSIILAQEKRILKFICNLQEIIWNKIDQKYHDTT